MVLIGSSVENVADGCRQVEQAGSTMDEIVVSVRRVADLMREITMANQDQTTGIDQVNQAVGQMDTVTQQKRGVGRAGRCRHAVVGTSGKELV